MIVNSLKKFLVSMGTVAVLGASLVIANGVDAFAAGTVTLHYHRDDGNYSDYTCKTWDEVNSQGTSNTFTEGDGEGTVSYEMSDDATLFSCVVQDANKQPIGDAEGKNLEFELGDAMAGQDIDLYLESGSDKLTPNKESTEASESEEAATTTAAEEDDTQQETEAKETTTTAAASTTVGTGGSTINEGIDIKARDEGREDSYYNAGIPARIIFIVVIVALSAGLSYFVNAKDRRIKVDEN
jgi:hypothetical protein